MIKQTLYNVLKDNKQSKISHLRTFYHYMRTKTYKFNKLGKDSVIINPIQITCPYCIDIGDNVFIWDGARINVIDEYFGNEYHPKLIIGDDVSMAQNVHIVCCNDMVLEKGVALGSFVLIADAYHGFDDTRVPIMQQKMKTSPIYIGENTAINSHCFISQGVTIGKECFIGAGSVVVKDIPDYSVAVGNPARVIRKRKVTI